MGILEEFIGTDLAASFRDILQQLAYSLDIISSDTKFQLADETEKWHNDRIWSEDTAFFADEIQHLPDEWLEVIES